MTDLPFPEDTAADHIAHLDTDISLYTDQLATLQNLVERYEQQLSVTRDRMAYISNQRTLAQKERDSFVKKSNNAHVRTKGE